MEVLIFPQSDLLLSILSIYALVLIKKMDATIDKGFGSDADKYAAYLETPEGRLRLDLSFANLQDFLPQPVGSLRALDLGGGTGAIAVRLARLDKSGITLTPAHRCTLVACATLRADIRDCWAEITKNHGAYTTAGTGAVKLHPAAARLDVLRRDLIKALGQLGLQKPHPDDPADNSPTLEEFLAG